MSLAKFALLAVGSLQELSFGFALLFGFVFFGFWFCLSCLFFLFVFCFCSVQLDLCVGGACQTFSILQVLSM